MNTGQPQFTQQTLEGEGFEISTAFILENKEMVTDFFGDNRHWYAKLLTSGQKYSSTSLDSQDDIHEDPNGNGEDEIRPLDPAKITEGRAENISKFFEEWKDARDDFVAYSKQGTI
jgi:hypothetical protein